MESPSREVLGTTHLIRFELQTQRPQGRLSECRVTEKGRQFYSAEIKQNWMFGAGFTILVWLWCLFMPNWQ